MYYTCVFNLFSIYIVNIFLSSDIGATSSCVSLSVTDILLKVGALCCCSSFSSNLCFSCKLAKGISSTIFLGKVSGLKSTLSPIFKPPLS